MLMAEQALGSEERRVLGEVLAVHDQVLPVHVDLDVRDSTGAKGVDHMQRHADVAHQDLHRRLRVLVLEEHRDAALACVGSGLADPVDEARPRLGVRRLERVVVALDPGPDDHLRADVAREVDRLPSQSQRLRRGSRRRASRSLPCRSGDRDGGRSRCSRCRVRRARPGPPRGSRAKAPAGSGTRSRRSARRALRRRCAPSGPSRRLASSGLYPPGLNRVAMLPNAQIPRLVFMSRPYRLLDRSAPLLRSHWRVISGAPSDRSGRRADTESLSYKRRSGHIQEGAGGGSLKLHI